MRPGEQNPGDGTAGRLQPPPYPAWTAAPDRSETAGQPPVHPWHATRERDYTPSLAVPEPQVRQGRGPRGQSKVTEINKARPLQALQLAADTLTSVLTQAARQNQRAAEAWSWTAVHLIDGLATLIEHGTVPHPWFRDPARWRLNPAGWAPPAAIAQVAARLAGQRNGEDQ